MATSSAATNEAHFPRAGLATDGWSTEDEATATCYCGAVQLAFVSPSSPQSKSLQTLTPTSANKRRRPSRILRLQLRRLPQNNRLNVCL